MRQNLAGRTIFVFVIIAIFSIGILFGLPDQWRKSYSALKTEGVVGALRQNIRLGLDLRGGTHLILQVQVQEAVNAETDQAIERIKQHLNNNKVNYTEIIKTDQQRNPERIEVRGVPPEGSSDLRTFVTEAMGGDYTVDPGPQNSFVITLKPAAVARVQRAAVSQSIETIRSRVDTLGVTEPVIQEHGLGEHQILVQLPGVDDPARVKQIIRATARLEIRAAIDSQGHTSEAAALQAHGGVLPPGSMMLRGYSVGSRGSSPTELVYVLQRTAVVGGQDIKDAQPGRGESGAPVVNFYLSNEGGRRFSAFTGANVGKSLAVVLDNRVREVATIQSEISDQGVITGGFTQETAKDLAMLLRSGALPASIRYLEERTVGPSLGAESIRRGVTTSIVGLAAVMAFMLFYYRGAGINANLALLLNVLILMGFIGFSGATLTLPGIAGVILTIGMGVDSNVLIFERIKEELKAGKAPAAAVDQGFRRAWLTIVDTHITTIVAAMLLFLFGTGPVRGFAVTLVFGLLANLFTAVLVSRVIFEWILSRKQRGAALSI